MIDATSWMALGPEIVLLVMACAIALREHLKESTRATLEAAWRRAIGELPA